MKICLFGIMFLRCLVPPIAAKLAMGFEVIVSFCFNATRAV